MLGIRLSKPLLLSSKPWLLAATAAMTLTGCPDPDAATQGFVERSEDDRKVKDAAVAVGFFDATGRYMLALAASVDTSKPVFFDAQITVEVEAKTIQITLQPLAVEGRTAVGDLITHEPVPIADDGKFTIDYGQVNIDGAADPLLPGQPIVTTLMFFGQTNSETEVCGQVDGQVMMPAMLPLEGSTFGVVPAPEGEFPLLEAVIGCAE